MNLLTPDTHALRLSMGLMLALNTALILAATQEEKSRAQEFLVAGYEQINAKKYTEALPNLEHAVALDPDNPTAHILLGDLLSRQQQTAQALIHYQAADTLKPNYFPILYRLANTEKDLGHLDNALTIARHLVALEPDNANTHALMATIFSARREIANAINAYQQALACDPTYMQLYKPLGDSYLAQGDFLNAWETFKHIDSKYKATPENPWWAGDDPTGKTILITDGGGFAGDPRIGGGYGDTFQTLRYVQELKKKNCTIIMQARPELVPLLSQCPYIDTLIAHGDPCPHYDLQTTTGRLFQNFNTSSDTIPHNVPYMYADPALIEHWQQQLAPDANIKIGLCWCAKQYWWCKSDGTTGPQKQPRSMPVDYCAQLAHIPGVSLYSLQKTYGEQDAKSFPITQFDQDFDQTNGRFMDTAAVMKNLDVIITVDTAIAHLAGALGVRVWLLLPYDADWRWLCAPESTPWYPTMRLFRQPKPDDWESVIHNVSRELQCRFLHKITKNSLKQGPRITKL